jgi:hypothetical protein
VQARLVAGWVESRTRRDARCSFEEDAELPYPAGSLLRVTIVADGETFQVERLDADTVIATSPRLPEQRRGLPVPTYPDLLAGELEFLARTTSSPTPRRGDRPLALMRGPWSVDRPSGQCTRL